MRLLLICALVFAAALQTAAQNTNGSFEGTVSKSGAGALEGVRISLASSRGPFGSTYTDSAGHFTFDNMPAGSYAFSVSRDGYFLPGGNQLQKIGGPGPAERFDGRVEIGTGQHIRDFHIELIATGTISGK